MYFSIRNIGQVCLVCSFCFLSFLMGFWWKDDPEGKHLKYICPQMTTTYTKTRHLQKSLLRIIELKDITTTLQQEMMDLTISTREMILMCNETLYQPQVSTHLRAYQQIFAPTPFTELAKQYAFQSQFASPMNIKSLSSPNHQFDLDQYWKDNSLSELQTVVLFPNRTTLHRTYNRRTRTRVYEKTGKSIELPVALSHLHSTAIIVPAMLLSSLPLFTRLPYIQEFVFSGLFGFENTRTTPFSNMCPPPSAIHVAIQWYQYPSAAQKDRNAEIASTLQINLLHPHITKIHVIVSRKEAPLLAAFHDPCQKLSIILDERPYLTWKTFMEATLYGSSARFLPEGSIVLFSHADILFAEGLEHIRHADFGTDHHKVVALSRHEMSPALPHCMNPDSLQNQCLTFVGSFDVFGFQLPIPSQFIDSVDHPRGSDGADNLFLTQALKHSFRGSNPCKTVKIFHNHCSGIKPHYTSGVRLNDPEEAGILEPQDTLEWQDIHYWKHQEEEKDFQ